MFKSVIKVLTGNIFSSVATYFCLIYIAYSVSDSDYADFTKFFYAISILYFILDFGLGSTLVVKLAKVGKVFGTLSLLLKFKVEYILLISFCVVVLSFVFQPVSVFLIIATSMIVLLNRFNSIKFQIIQDWTSSAKCVFVLVFTRALLVILFLLYLNLNEFKGVESIDIEFCFFISTLISASFSQKIYSKKLHKWPKLDLEKNEVFQTSKYIYIGGVFAAICMRADVFLIDYFLSSEDAGVYAKVSVFFFVFPMLISSINSVLLRYYSSTAGEDINWLNKKTIYFFLFFIFIYLYIFIFNRDEISNLVSFNVALIFSILLFSYFGALISSSYESKLISINQKFFMFIKIAQLITLVIFFIATYRYFHIVSAAIAFLASRVTGWMMVFYFYKRKL